MMSTRPTAAHMEEAVDLLPWAPDDEAGLRYRQELIAQALATAQKRGAQRGGAAKVRHVRDLAKQLDEEANALVVAAMTTHAGNEQVYFRHQREADILRSTAERIRAALKAAVNEAAGS